jgi:hypothetical protein
MWINENGRSTMAAATCTGAHEAKAPLSHPLKSISMPKRKLFKLMAFAFLMMDILLCG